MRRQAELLREAGQLESAVRLRLAEDQPAAGPSRVEVAFRWAVALAFAGLVMAAASTFVTVIIRSPNTMATFAVSGGGYSRTELAELGVKAQFMGIAPYLGNEPRTIYVRAGCAGCHGLRGEGTSVAVGIWDKSEEQMLRALRNGMPGMPTYNAGRLTDYQVSEVTRYLNELWGGVPDR